jgi:polyisoprenyl-teichoic acid--peptidoglycan teichoic acid transferase
MRRRQRITTGELAQELGVPPREVRRRARERFPRRPEARGRPWLLTRRQARALRRSFRPTPRRRRILAVLASLVLLLGAGAGGIAAAAYWQAEAYVAELQAGPKREVVEAVRQELDVPPRRPAVPLEPGPAKTILVVGSDARFDEQQNRRSDTILLVRVDPTERRIAMLSVPRDLLLEIPGHRTDRINMAYKRGGVPLLARTLRERLGVEINHFVEVDFRGFRQLVSALGGVYLPVDGRYFNRNLGTPGTNYAEIDLRPGYQRLDGEQALAFARYRHGDSDLIRAARQQLLIREAARQLVASRYDVLKLRRLIGVFAEATTSDIDDLGTIWRLFRAVENTPSNRVARFTVPATEAVIGGAFYVTSTTAQTRRTVRAWYGQPKEVAGPHAPEQAPATGEQGSRQPQESRPEREWVLVADGGRGAQLAAAVGPVAACVPSALPRGYYWPERGAAHQYRLDGRPAAAFSATRGSGRSVLWTMTTWKSPPVLAGPTATVEREGRTYELWREPGGRVRQIAWQLGDVRVWITNTLTNELTAQEMLQLADSCH